MAYYSIEPALLNLHSKNKTQYMAYYSIEPALLNLHSKNKTQNTSILQYRTCTLKPAL